MVGLFLEDIQILNGLEIHCKNFIQLLLFHQYIKKDQDHLKILILIKG